MRVVIGDNWVLFRMGLRQVLRSQPDIEVVGDANTAAETVRLVAETGADIAIIGADIGGGSLAAIQQITDTSTCRVVLFESAARAFEKSLIIGARGYLTRQTTNQEIITALQRVHNGEVYIDAPMHHTLLDMLRNPERQLSERELAILRLVAQGTTNRVIGERLGLSERTVKEYVSEAMQKLTARDRTHAVTIALQRGLLLLQDLGEGEHHRAA